MEKNRSLWKSDLLKLVKNCNVRVFVKPGIMLLISLLSITPVLAQSRMLTGKVVDSQNAPLPGVNVVIKGTLSGTVTDIDGIFRVEAAPTDILIFSFIGFNEQEILVGNQSAINVSLLISTRDLDEIVVVGYGVQKKSVVTAAISSIKSEDLEKTSLGRVEHAMQGRSAGVTVMPTSGAPGAGVKVRIRGVGSNGNTDPLYIVDGMKTGSINDLDPSDISSVEILKDAASAAIYGTEGANGVILITTKQGIKGKTQVNYDFQYGIQSLSTNAELMNAAQYKQFMTEAGQIINNTEGYNTDWLDAISESAPMQRHHISFTGGSEKSVYLLSGSYLTQDGAIGGSNANFERYTFRINTKNDVKSWLEVGNNLNFSHTKRKLLPEDDEYRSIVNSALLMDPFTPVFEKGITSQIQDIIDSGSTVLQNSKGQYYGLNRYVSGETANPVAFIENTNNIITTDKLLASFYGTLKPMKGLNITSRVGLELTYMTQNSWSPKYYFSSERSNEVNIVEDRINKYRNVLWENFASYNKKIKNHDFTAMAGMSYEDYVHPNYYLKSQMPKEGSQYAYHDFSVEKTTNRVGGTFDEITKISYFGRLSYNYSGKYLLEASIRSDAASILPVDNRWATFPAISGGWVVSEEDFWPTDIVSFAKMRLSWGQNGSINNVIAFSDREFWVSQNISYPNENEDLNQGVRIDKPTNPDLGWETSEQTNIGLDLRFLDSKFNLSVDYFKKLTKDLIINGAPVPSVGYYNVPSVNGGTVENKGFEIEAGYRNSTSGGLKYAVNVNLTTLSNKVTELNSATPIPGANVRGYEMTWFEKGKPLWYFKGYKTNGIDPQTGEVIVVDVTGEGDISAADITDIGNPHPDLIYGASISLEYKNFDFNMFLQGMKGNDIFMAWFRTDRELTNKPSYFFTDRWTGPGSKSSMPKPDNSSDEVYRSDLMVQDGSYMRIKQIQLGYSIPKTITNSFGIEKIRAYVSLDDYFTFTKYKGMDPEAGSNSDNRQGIDKGLYPLTKKLMFGVSVNF